MAGNFSWNVLKSAQNVSIRINLGKIFGPSLPYKVTATNIMRF